MYVIIIFLYKKYNMENPGIEPGKSPCKDNVLPFITNPPFIKIFI